MAQTLNGCHYVGSNPIQAPSFTLIDFVSAATGQARAYLALCTPGDLNHRYQVGLDVTSASNLPSMLSAAPNGSNQALSPTALTANVWHGLVGYVQDGNVRGIGFDGGNEATPSNSGSFLPSVTQTLVSGRPDNNTNGIGGIQGPIAIYNRVLSLIERKFIGLGNHPRALPGLARWWKFDPTQLSVITDEMGVENLAVVGGPSTAATAGNFATFMTHGPMPNLLLGIGANQSTNLGALFDNVFSTFTCSILQLGAAVQVGTTAAAQATASQIAGLSALGALANGDYIQIGLGGTPTRVYAADTGTANVLFATPQTWANAAPVFRIPVATFTPSGFPIAGNVLNPSPSVQGTYPQCVVRATCNGAGGLFADSNLFTVTVSNAAGGAFPRPRRRRRKLYIKVYTRR